MYCLVVMQYFGKKYCGISKFPLRFAINLVKLRSVGAAVISKIQTGCIYGTQLARKAPRENKSGMLLKGCTIPQGVRFILRSVTQLSLCCYILIRLRGNFYTFMMPVLLHTAY